MANNSADRRLVLVRSALEDFATGRLDALLDANDRDALGRSLVSLERWLSGGQRTLPELDAKRAVRRLSKARGCGVLPPGSRGVYRWLHALVWRAPRVF